jgi:predicted transcriptional regulator
MLDSIVTSKTRVKLLLKFFMNTDTRSYLRELADEFGDSTNSIRVELNHLTKAGLLESHPNGRTILYQANKKHPLFSDLQSIVRKFTGIDQLIDIVLAKLGSVELAFVTGDYAKGIDSGIIDVIIVGNVDHTYLQNLVGQVEALIGRKIRSLVLNKKEFKKLASNLKIDSAVTVWNEAKRSNE